MRTIFTIFISMLIATAPVFFGTQAQAQRQAQAQAQAQAVAPIRGITQAQAAAQRPGYAIMQTRFAAQRPGYAIMQTRFAAQRPVLSAAYISLPGFLSEMELTLEEFFDLAAEIEAEGTYAHYLEENAARYEAFQKANPAIPAAAAIAYVNVNVDLGHYEGIQEIPEQELGSMTMLVNKNFALPIDWVPDDLIKIDGGFEVREEAAEHLLNLQSAMRDAGLKMHIRSTFRTSATSARLYSDAVSSWGQETADLNWARGGHSEHNTGLAADILHRTDTQTLTEARFESTDEFKWMRDNAHLYGFILRYPAEYEDIHGYKFEPWHWRYVGIEIATAMKNMNIPVFEEFYGRFLLSDVLNRVKEYVYDKQLQAELEEQERLEREEQERLAQEEAEREAERLAREAAQAEQEAAQAAREEEARRLAEEIERRAAEQAAIRDMSLTFIVSAVLTIAILGTAVGMYFMHRRKK